MREDNEDGRPHIYWIGYKSQLLRAAPHHVRPEIGKSTDSLAGNLQDAKDVIKSHQISEVTWCDSLCRLVHPEQAQHRRHWYG